MFGWCLSKDVQGYSSTLVQCFVTIFAKGFTVVSISVSQFHVILSSRTRSPFSRAAKIYSSLGTEDGESVDSGNRNKMDQVFSELSLFHFAVFISFHSLSFSNLTAIRLHWHCRQRSMRAFSVLFCSFLHFLFEFLNFLCVDVISFCAILLFESLLSLV